MNCQVVKEKKIGNSLQFAFIELDKREEAGHCVQSTTDGAVCMGTRKAFVGTDSAALQTEQ
jgi:hypothetical protein